MIGNTREPDKIVQNHKGGKCSDNSNKVLYNLLPPEALKVIAERFTDGAKIYGNDNWKNLDKQIHWEKLLRHIMDYWLGDRGENHLGAIGFHIMCYIWHVENENKIKEEREALLDCSDELTEEEVMRWKELEKRTKGLIPKPIVLKRSS